MSSGNTSSRIQPGQYSRHAPVISQRSSSPIKPALAATEPRSPGKENDPRLADPASPTRGRAQQPVDPKYRLRGNSPEGASKTATGSLFGSLSPIKKSLRSRSRSRSRIFGKDKSDASTANANQYASTRTPHQIDADFVDLLDEMQVHPDLRTKLLALNSTVKSSMLQGQATLSLAAFSDLEAGSASEAHGKMARKPIPELLKERPGRPQSGFLEHRRAATSDGSSAQHPTAAPSSSGLQRFPSKVEPVGSVSSSNGTGSRIRATSVGEKSTEAWGKETPESFATMLKCTDAASIDVARVKRMRAVVASESPAWISAFIGPECCGYDAMIFRLNELLGMEWREEQHDDMLLHELLRCFVALNTTEIGRQALASQAPRPFGALVELLFSEKKPGDLSTRKLIVDLLHILLHLQLPASQSHSHSSLNYLLELLQNPVDPAKEAVVDFIKDTHTPRVFKTYVVEMAAVCRDYFWIFCHSQNYFWRFDEMQDGQRDVIQGPKVPGGMTGGVEFEAMAYLTAHLRLINTVAAVLAQWKPHQLPTPRMTALELHANLFASGMERVLATLRRSSQHYYASTHLELAKYLDLATRAGFALPYHLTDWLATSTIRDAPSLPPILQVPSILPSTAVSAQAPAPAPAGYGLAAQFIAPAPPLRQSSCAAPEPAVPARSETMPDEEAFWNFDQPAIASAPQEAAASAEETDGAQPTAPFSLADFDSQFFVFPSPARNLPVEHTAMPQSPVRAEIPAAVSLVGSAIRKWESRSNPSSNPAVPKPRR